MRKFQTWLIGIALCGVLVSSVSFASFTGGGGSGLSITEIINQLVGIYAKLDETNDFSKDQTIDDPDALVGGTFSGMRVQTTEIASVCIGPSDGQNREFCMSGGQVLMLHGANSDIYDGASTGNITLMSDSGLNRHWFAPTGSLVVAGGVQPPIENAFMVGSNTESLATFSVDTTNDWVKFIPSNPSALNCSGGATSGRFAYNASTRSFKFCDGAAWKSIGATSSQTITEEVYKFPSNLVSNIYADGSIRFRWDGGVGNDLEMRVDTLPSGGFLSYSCENFDTQNEATVNTIGVVDIWGNLNSGNVIDCVIQANTDTSYRTYYLNVYRTGTGSDLISMKLKVVR